MPNWLGDAVMASYALEILRYGGAKKLVLIAPLAVCELFADNSDVYAYEDNSKTQKNIFKRIAALWRLSKNLPKCESSITFQNSFLSALFLRFCGAKIRVGFANEGRSFLLSLALKKPKNMHEALRFAELAKSVIIESGNLETFKERTNGVGADFIEKKYYLHSAFSALCSTNSRIIGFGAGAAFGAAKKWPSGYYAALAKFLISQNYKILLFGSKDDCATNNEIYELLSEEERKNVENLSAKTTIKELMEKISTCCLFIGNDSGAAHIANALNVRSFVIFGPTDFSETAPLFSQNTKIISLKDFDNLPSCAPCKKRICPKSTKAGDFHCCMMDLKPQMVIEKIKEIL